MSDNGPQYASASFSHFASDYGFDHVTSSPRYPQSNGAAERAVKTVKSLLTKNDDPYVALWGYRSTPLENGYSPAELLMGHRLRTTVPVHSSQLIPRLPRASQLREEEKIRERQQRNFDKRHRALELTPLQPGDCVWIPDTESEGTVTGETNPRSYTVRTPSGSLRKNRRHLISLPHNGDRAGDDSSATSSATVTSQGDSASVTLLSTSPESSADQRCTRSGRVIRPPDRL